nr:hypothetical protein CFP56_35825 [Quercus suber]
MWLQDQRCERVVTDAWNEGQMGGSAFPINACLDLCRNRLEAWNTSEYGHVGKEISHLQKRLEWLELLPISPSTIRDKRETKIELNCWNQTPRQCELIEEFAKEVQLSVLLLEHLAFSTVEIRYSKTSSVLDLAVKMSRYLLNYPSWRLFKEAHFKLMCHVNLVVDVVLPLESNQKNVLAVKV